MRKLLKSWELKLFTDDFLKANMSIDIFLKVINESTKDGEKIISTENIDNEILKLFDKCSGIDAIQITKDAQIRTMAIRVQFGNVWNTFTIRFKRHTGAKTEYEKRLEAIQNEKLYPNLTLQCYLSLDLKEILSYGLIFTKDLYNQIQNKPEIVNYKTATEDGNIFMFISFYDLDKILIYENSKSRYYSIAKNRNGP